ncbi:MAG: cell division FtsA domain-containing protein, partial [Deinococcales bacterium]
LNDSEQELTTLLIDIGGGTTDVGVFRRGTLAHSAVIPLGGDHITQDISQLLRIPPDEAERVKRRYGVALPELADRDVELEVANPSYTASISTFELAQVIKPRVIEILDLVKRNIEQRMGALELLAGNVVVTGGASLMPGIEQVATDRFRLPVRIGKPEGVSGLADVVASPAHATAVGLVRFGMTQLATQPASVQRHVKEDDRGLGGFFSSIRNILKDFF